MRATFHNRVISSFYLWIDHTILKEGEAFSNFSSNFYNIRDNFSNVYSYGLPFRQIVSDSSITGATILSGIYINGSFSTTGNNNFIDVNYNRGEAYFSSNRDSDVLSGDYSVKDFNIYLSNEPDYRIIFEKRHTVQSRTSTALTGLAPQENVVPCIYLINRNLENEPFAFGGTDISKIYMRAIVLSDNSFKLDAVNSILVDQKETVIPIFEESQFPFNSYGGFKNGSYNFETLDNATPTKAYLTKVNASHLSNAPIVIPEIRDVYENLFISVVDFTLETYRNPRQ